MVLVQPNKHYTYSDYASWNDDTRYELIDGMPYLMSPAPSEAHQTIAAELTYQLVSFLKGKPCKVLPAPFDVRLNADDGDDTVVQPDLLVVCDSIETNTENGSPGSSKLDGKVCTGAPDMVIEILSPSTARMDKFIKFRLYQKAGVREYWIVDPDTKTVQVCFLKNGEYVINAYDDTETVPVQVLKGCAINLTDVFA
jgi:Uma2 family endonuclease